MENHNSSWVQTLIHATAGSGLSSLVHVASEIVPPEGNQGHLLSSGLGVYCLGRLSTTSLAGHHGKSPPLVFVSAHLLGFQCYSLPNEDVHSLQKLGAVADPHPCSTKYTVIIYSW
jgi:hypothetical protein